MATESFSRVTTEISSCLVPASKGQLKTLRISPILKDSCSEGIQQKAKLDPRFVQSQRIHLNELNHALATSVNQMLLDVPVQLQSRHTHQNELVSCPRLHASPEKGATQQIRCIA